LFGAQVRGGESAALVQISCEPVESQPDVYDLFFALDWKKIDQFAPEIPLNSDSIVFADPVAGPVPASVAKSKPKVVTSGFGDPNETRLERAMRGPHVNVVAAAYAAAIAGIDRAHVANELADLFKASSAETRNANSRALAIGSEKAAGLERKMELEKPQAGKRWLITGNQAVALGALRGGVRFVGCYPITPATDLVEWLAPRLRDLGGTLVPAEDEIASINMVLGASYAGTPAMTVTSGPGLALMTEAIGLGVAAEIPALVIDVMRAGPSTGIASKTEQSDLNIAIYGGHGDAPRIVVAPVSLEDCANTAEWAVYLAESRQTPVLLLSDQAIGQARGVIPQPTKRPKPLGRKTQPSSPPAQFKRYAIEPDPVTAMTRPGTDGYEWVAEGLTHNEAGLPVSAAGAHVAQLNKRAKKLEFDPGDLWGERYGEGETAIIAFGSGVAPARRAAERLTADGRPVRVIALRLLSPVPCDHLAQALKGARRIVVLEQNQSGQLLRHLLANKAVPPSTESIARPGPLPFRPAEIALQLS
jgi:2-oxoglutarate/2-oxoacid ferredoxin oxidoreductase subunit alpha